MHFSYQCTNWPVHRYQFIFFLQLVKPPFSNTISYFYSIQSVFSFMPLPSIYLFVCLYTFTHSHHKFQHNGFACKITPVPNAIERLDICPPRVIIFFWFAQLFYLSIFLGSHPVFWSFSHPRSFHVLQFWTTCYTAMEFYLHSISVFFLAQFPASLIFLFRKAQVADCPPFAHPCPHLIAHPFFSAESAELTRMEAATHRPPVSSIFFEKVLGGIWDWILSHAPGATSGVGWKSAEHSDRRDAPWAFPLTTKWCKVRS